METKRKVGDRVIINDVLNEYEGGIYVDESMYGHCCKNATIIKIEKDECSDCGYVYFLDIDNGTFMWTNEMFKSSLKIKTIIDDSVELPKYETELSAGMDCRAFKYSLPNNLKDALEFPQEGYILKPFQRVLIKTGIKLEIPDGYELQVRSRSGLALKFGIFVLNGIGTIDADYRGDIGVILANFSSEDFVIKKGDRIGQFVFNKFEKIEYDITNQLSETERGEGGFNSTGTNK